MHPGHPAGDELAPFQQFGPGSGLFPGFGEEPEDDVVPLQDRPGNAGQQVQPVVFRGPGGWRRQAAVLFAEEAGSQQVPRPALRIRGFEAPVQFPGQVGVDQLDHALERLAGKGPPALLE